MNKILSETRMAVERIIVDDGSADETASVLRQRHDGLLILTGQANQSVYGRKCYQRCESGSSAIGWRFSCQRTHYPSPQ
ncbi:hypothetical protein [Citrobacter sp. VF227]